MLNSLNGQSLFSQKNILQFPDVVALENILLAHSFVTKCLPVSFLDFFTLANEIHGYGTRRTANVFFKVNTVNTSRFGTGSIKNQCIKSWNCLLMRHQTLNFLDIKRVAPA